jgi:hypothetical protein
MGVSHSLGLTPPSLPLSGEERFGAHHDKGAAIDSGYNTREEPPLGSPPEVG